MRDKVNDTADTNIILEEKQLNYGIKAVCEDNEEQDTDDDDDDENIDDDDDNTRENDKKQEYNEYHAFLGDG